MSLYLQGAVLPSRPTARSQYTPRPSSGACRAPVGRLSAAAVLHLRVFSRGNPRSYACPRRASGNHGSCGRRSVVAASQSTLARSGRAGEGVASMACQG